jgi:hypothetical protein
MTSNEFDKAVIAGALKSAMMKLDELFAKGSQLESNPKIKKEWVGLTDDEIHKIEQECDQKFEDYFEFANAIEAKLKEKNT